MGVVSSYRRKHTFKTDFDLEKGELFFDGFSIPTNAYELYTSLLGTINQSIDILKNQEWAFKIIVKLDCLSASAVQVLNELFKQFIKIKGEHGVQVDWYYDIYDSEFLETATMISDSLALPFNFIVNA